MLSSLIMAEMSDRDRTKKETVSAQQASLDNELVKRYIERHKECRYNVLQRSDQEKVEREPHCSASS